MYKSSRLNLNFQVTTQILDWVQIWGLTCPFQYIYITFMKPCFRRFCSVLWVIIFLENPIKGKSRFSTEIINFASKIFRCAAAFILPNITEMLPVPFAEKYPQTLMLPTPDITVEIVFFCLKACPSSLNICTISRITSKQLNLYSSVHNTLS